MLDDVGGKGMISVQSISKDMYHWDIVEGSLEAKLPTIWRNENAVQSSRSSEMKKVRREKMQVREKGREVAKHCVFPVFCGSGGSKSRLAKAAGAETSGQMRK